MAGLTSSPFDPLTASFPFKTERNKGSRGYFSALRRVSLWNEHRLELSILGVGEESQIFIFLPSTG